MDGASVDAAASVASEGKQKGSWQFTDKDLLQQKREQITRQWQKS